MSNTITDGRRHDFFMVDNAVMDHLGEKLGPYAGWVYMAIVRHANYQTNVAFPSITTIQKKTGISRPKVVSCIEELEILGLIEVTRKKNKDGSQQVNHYKLMPVDAVVNEVNQGSNPDLPVVVNEVDSNDTKENETKEQDKDSGADAPEPPTPKTTRKRNPLFDAIAECSFQFIPGASIPSDVAKRIGKVRKNLAELDPPVDAEEFRKACLAYQDSGLTPARDAVKAVTMINDYRSAKGSNAYGRKATGNGRENGRGAGAGKETSAAESVVVLSYS